MSTRLEENLKVGWKSVVFGLIGGAVGSISWLFFHFSVYCLSFYIVGEGIHLGTLTPIFACPIGVIGGLLSGNLLGFLIGSGVSLGLRIPIIFLTGNALGSLLAFPCIPILVSTFFYFSTYPLIFGIMCLLPGLLNIIGVVLGTLWIISLDSYRLGISIKWRNLPLLLICYIIVFIIVLVSNGLLLGSKTLIDLEIRDFLLIILLAGSLVALISITLIALTKYSVFKRKNMVYEQSGGRNYSRRTLLVFLIIFGLAVAEIVGVFVLIGISGCPKISKKNIPFDTPSDVKAQIKRLYSLKPVERGKAALKLGRMGTQATSAVPFLISMMHDNSFIFLGKSGEGRTYVNREVIWALGKIKDPRAVEPLINILIQNTLFKGYRYRIRSDTVNALGEMKDPRAIEPLIDALKDEGEEYFRKEVAEALKKITERDFGHSYEEWREWWEKNK